MARKKALTKAGIQIKMKLLEKNMSQREFCKQCGFSETRLSEIMVGRKGLNEIKKKISEELGVSFSGDGETQ
jgi:transcriptional regulator with XRE-family HTH domain